jgi:fatty-acyl-CoA synthase
MLTTATDLHPRDSLAHVIGAVTPALWHRTIPEVVGSTVAEFGDREAAVFVEQNVRFSWTELAQEIDALAAGLHDLGLRTGDRIGIWSPNRYEWLLTQFATARLGLVLVTINPAYRLAEVEYVINKVGCTALVTATNFKTSDYTTMLQNLAPELESCAPGALVAAKLPTLKTIIQMGADPVPGMFGFQQIVTRGRGASIDLDAVSAKLDADDAVNIQFTSGTTGAPKGATLTHINIVNNGRYVVGAQRFSEADRLCIPVPLYHCFGMVMGTLGCATVGAAMIFAAEGFDPDSTLKAISKEKCTAIYGVPTMFVAMLDHPDLTSYDLSSLRTGIMAGAPCPIEVMKRCVADMHLDEITIAYGMTETSPVSFQTATDDPLDKRVSTVGRIQPHVECKIIDETGATVTLGKQGELCTRGYSVMKGYWGDEERTAVSIDADGWMHSGDLAIMDEEGYCNITGRLKDMLIRGGENVYPREIEEFLYRHPAVQQVQVFGVPDAKYGEEICAWIILKMNATATEDEIKEFCRGQIAHYKIPRYVRFRNELPMTVTGKAQKFRMRDTMVEELGLVAAETA